MLFAGLFHNFLFLLWLNLFQDHGIFLSIILCFLVVPVSPSANNGHPLPATGPVVIIVHAGDLVHSKPKVHYGGSGDHDHLEHPEANVRQWRKRVIAHILATRLRRVTHKFTLFIVVDRLAPDCCQHDPKDDEEREPDFAHKSGVIGNFIQKACEEAPAHVALETGKLSNLRRHGKKLISNLIRAHLLLQ